MGHSYVSVCMAATGFGRRGGPASQREGRTLCLGRQRHEVTARKRPGPRVRGPPEGDLKNHRGALLTMQDDLSPEAARPAAG